jgi:endonuclease YncB( thermonuclease family)
MFSRAGGPSEAQVKTSWVCRLLAVTGLLLAASPASADVLEGRVIGIADGDTLTVLTNSQSQVEVRLAGIDAPERGESFGERSKQNLALLVGGKLVEVRWHKKDRYGLVVGQVWVVSPDARCQGASCPKTLDAGLAQVTVGLAWHYKQSAGEQSEEDQERYAFAEVEARARKVGLWRDAGPVAPWEWRRGR